MKKAMLFLVALLFSVGANAATFDFLAEANLLERGYDEYSLTVGTETVKATGQYFDAGWKDAYAYMDSGNAGLGVCKVLDAGYQCNPSNDDNVTYNEKLTLDFGTETILTEVTFLNGDHEPLFSDGLYFRVDGGSWTWFALAPSVIFDVAGTVFEFGNGSSTDQFYLSSVTAVPVPAAAFLFAPALLGLFGLRRKAQA